MKKNFAKNNELLKKELGLRLKYYRSLDNNWKMQQFFSLAFLFSHLFTLFQEDIIRVNRIINIITKVFFVISIVVFFSRDRSIKK